MKKFLDKAKSSFKDSPHSQQQQQQQPLQTHDQPSTITPPSPLDIIRYRYHHGTNLGSIFVLEQWLSNSMFIDGCPGGSELDAVSYHLAQHGPDATRQKWQDHWANAVSDSDFDWLVREAKCTSIRLPVGYFTFGRKYCRGTPFEKVAEVYDGAWAAVRTFVERARSWGIGVLLDLHALPGGANGDAHSGSSTGKPEFWGSRKNMDLATRCLVFMAQEVQRGMDGVIGIQLCNEAVWDAKGMYDWYEHVISEISAVDDSIPIYISDAWDLNRALGWTNSRHALRGVPKNPIIVDTHKYYTFSDADRAKAPPQIISSIPNELNELSGKEGSLADRGEAQVIVGEYSCVLDGQTWSRCRPEEKEGFVAQFGQAQSQRFQQRTGGAYFWTYKMDWMDGGEWGFAEQTKKHNIAPPAGMLLAASDVKARAQKASDERARRAQEAQSGHENYWNATAPGKQFEHQRYGDGWQLGYSDALTFFAARADGAFGGRAGEGADRVGCADVWIKKRLLESGQRGEFVWEWEQGFRAGLAAFYEVVGI